MNINESLLKSENVDEKSHSETISHINSIKLIFF